MRVCIVTGCNRHKQGLRPPKGSGVFLSRRIKLSDKTSAPPQIVGLGLALGGSLRMGKGCIWGCEPDEDCLIEIIHNLLNLTPGKGSI